MHFPGPLVQSDGCLRLYLGDANRECKRAGQRFARMAKCQEPLESILVGWCSTCSMAACEDESIQEWRNCSDRFLPPRNRSTNIESLGVPTMKNHRLSVRWLGC